MGGAVGMRKGRQASRKVVMWGRPEKDICKDHVWIRPSMGLGLSPTSPNNEFIERALVKELVLL